MSESIFVDSDLPRSEKYNQLFIQLKSLTESETDLIANMANITAALKEVFGFLWIGFYLVKEQELVLGPFQGPVACTRIGLGKGVCGTAWNEKRTIVVPDVDQFAGHIACSSKSKSEIVIPIFDKAENVFGVLDVDSQTLGDFGEADSHGLSRIISLLQVQQTQPIYDAKLDKKVPGT